MTKKWERLQKQVELRPGGSFFAFLLAFLLFSRVAAAWQESAPEVTQKETAPTFQSRVNSVLVPVVVRDGQGRALVHNLTKITATGFDDKIQYCDAWQPRLGRTVVIGWLTLVVRNASRTGLNLQFDEQNHLPFDADWVARRGVRVLTF